MRYPFHIFTIGWEPYLIDHLLAPIEKRTGINFTHGLVGNSTRLPLVEKECPGSRLLALSKRNYESLPPPDYELLRGIEAAGVSTIRSMIQGDRVLSLRPANESLGYAVLLAKRMRTVLEELKPDLVLGGFDSLHGGMGLLVSKSLGIPWVALQFPVIPDNLTGFCKSLTPDSLVPIERPVDADMREEAQVIIGKVRAGSQRVLALASPASLSEKLRRYGLHARNLFRRFAASQSLGVDRFVFPTKLERMSEIVRRARNTLEPPSAEMLTEPPAEKFAFFPLQMSPESSIDTWAPFYRDQLSFIVQLSLALPIDLELVVKLHFSDPDNYGVDQLRELMKLPRLRIAHPSALGRAFLEQATLVVAIQGTASLEAALLGKPVLIFGDSPYQHFPRTERAKRPDEIYEQIRQMLQLGPPSDEEIVEAFAAYMARYMPGRINDWSRPIREDELERLSDCFSALRSYVEVPENHANWYRQAPFESEMGQQTQ